MSEPIAVGAHLDGDFKAMLERRRLQAEKAQERINAFNASPEGQAVAAERARAEAQQAAAESARKWLVTAQQIGLPLRYLKANLKNVDQTAFPPGVGVVIQKTVERVRAYMSNDFDQGRALVLCGTPGTGKTYCAAAAAGYVHRQTRCTDRMFWKTSTLRASLMDLNRRGPILDSLTTVRMLVLDDVGVEFSKEGDFFETILDAVIDEREANLRPLIMTSNLTPEKLATKLGPRAWDRLTGNWGAVSTIVGPSARKSLQHPRPARNADHPQPQHEEDGDGR